MLVWWLLLWTAVSPEIRVADMSRYLDVTVAPPHLEWYPYIDTTWVGKPPKQMKVLLWQCSTCTKINDFSRVKCAVCPVGVRPELSEGCRWVPRTALNPHPGADVYAIFEAAAKLGADTPILDGDVECDLVWW